jgi:hypothetical protein
MQSISRGARSHLIDVQDNGRRIAGALLLHCKPQPNDHFASRALRLGVVECLGGPVLPADVTPELLSELLNRIEALVIELGASRLSFVAPPSAAVWPELISDVFHARGYRQTSLSTSLIDLTRAPDSIFACFDAAARKGVRKCEKHGLIVEECCDWKSYYCEFLLPFYSSAGHETLIPRGEEVERMIWSEEVLSGLYRFFIARVGNGPVLATLGTHAFNGLATEIASGRTPEGISTDVPAQDLLHWKAFSVHKMAGDLIFDMAGFSSAPASPKEAGIKRFKQKWGGQTVEVASYHRDFPTLANTILGAGGRVMRLVQPRVRWLSS